MSENSRDWALLSTRWGMRLGLAGCLAAVLEFLGACFHAPVTTSDVLGLVHLLLALVVTFSLVGLPVAVVGVVLDRCNSRSWRIDPSQGMALFVGAVTTTAILWLAVEAFESFPANEFPNRTDILKALMVFGVIGAGVTLTLALVRLFDRARPHLPNLLHPRVVLSFLAAVASVIGFFTIHIGMAPIHLFHEIRVTGLLAVFFLVVAVRFAVVDVRPKVARASAVLWLAACAFAFFASCRNDHARFVLFAHCPTASNLAGAMRDTLDFDGDGAAASWLGGADCREFDATVGPANLEIPGDGIDQDCRGGDATNPAPSGPPKPWPNCPQLPHPANVLLITVDALRADAVQPRVMPNLRQFASLTTDFKRAYVPATQTKYSMASMFAGRPVSDLGSSNVIAEHDLHMGRPLAMRFLDARYETVHFNLLRVHEALTIGFEQMNPGRSQFDVYPTMVKLAFASAGMTTSFIALLEEPRSRPLFAWLHYPDVHAPYLMSTDWSPEGLSPYEAEASYVDFHLGRLFGFLRARGMEKNTIIAVTSDHGEDLGERGREGHGPSAYESTIHVPLLLWVPGCAPRTVTEPVSLSRLGTTLAFLAGVKMPGRTLLPHEGVDVPVVSEVAQVLDLFQRAVVGERYKLIVDVRNGGRVLFDLHEDPGETTNVYRKRPKEAAELERRYQVWLDSAGQR